jgi:hypothetical protein
MYFLPHHIVYIKLLTMQCSKVDSLFYCLELRTDSLLHMITINKLIMIIVAYEVLILQNYFKLKLYLYTQIYIYI